MESLDLQLIEKQLGRRPRGVVGVGLRCPAGYPRVIVTKPVVEPGQVFPTTYWLTCPHLVKEVSRLESQGLVGELTERALHDADFARELVEAHEEYKAARQALLSPEEWETLKKEYPEQYASLQESGIAGIKNPGVKCLHAHLAHYLVGGRNPVGRIVWELIKEKACTRNRLASIGVGTNSTRLLIAEAGCGVTPVYEDIDYPRIGSSLEKGLLTEEAMERTLGVIRRFLKIVEEYQAELSVIFATSAVRSARNQGEFAQRVLEVVGQELRVLSGQEEALWTYKGATYGMVQSPSLVDIGGGSTEFVIDGSFTSLNVGAVRLHEAYFATGLPTQAQLDQARADIQEKLARIPVSNQRLVVVGGTATTLASIELGLEEYDAKQVHGRTLSQEVLRRWLVRLAELPVAERTKFPGLPPERADIIFSGTLILLTVMEHLNVLQVQVSVNDIMLGALLWQLGEGR